MEVKFNSYDSIVELNSAKAALDYLINNSHDGPKVVDGSLPDSLKDAGDQPPITTAPPPPEIPQPPVATAPAATAPPPPPAAAPPAAAPPAAAPAGDLERDNAGCPWDARIHSSGKTKTSAGKWVRKRNIDDNDYRIIMQEITDPNFDPTVPFEEPPVAEVAAPDPAAAGFGNGAGALEWPDVVQKVMSAKLTDVITQEQVDRVVDELGVEGGFNAMVSRPDLYPQLMIALNL